MIRSVDGKQVNNVKEFIDALRARGEKKVVNVQLIRSQKLLSTELLVE